MTQSTQKNKIKIFFFKVFKYLSKSKFSILHSQCPIFKSKPSVFKISSCKIFLKIWNSKFQVSIFQNFKFQILQDLKFQNFRIQFQNLQFSKLLEKIQTSDFMIRISSLNFQNPKSQNFRFQVPNFNSKSQSFKVSIFLKCQFQNFQVSKIKCFSKIESFVN